MRWTVLSAVELAPDDRGLAYGDGLFETIAVEGGRLSRFAWHRQRLANGLDRLKIPARDVLSVLDAELDNLVKGHGAAVAKIIVTRGSNERGYAPPATPNPVVQVGIGDRAPLRERDYTEGVEIGICQTPVSIAPHLAGMKHLNRLDQVMAAGELKSSWAEGLMFDPEGYLVGGTKTNVFLIRRGTLLTPKLDRCGVEGVMRRLVMAAAPSQGLRVREQRLRRSHLSEADSVFLTNTLVGLWPVASLEGHTFEIPTLLDDLRVAMERTIK